MKFIIILYWIRSIRNSLSYGKTAAKLCLPIDEFAKVMNASESTGECVNASFIDNERTSWMAVSHEHRYLQADTCERF